MLVGLRCLRSSCTYKLSSGPSRPTLASNMHWSANALSALTSDTEPTIVLEFESAKYIFNVGENTMRAFVQSRQNFKKTRGLFMTSVGSQRAGGLAGEWLHTEIGELRSAIAGILMTLADSKQHNVDVIGPEGIIHFLAAMRRYAYRYILCLFDEIIIKVFLNSPTLAVNPAEVPLRSSRIGRDEVPPSCYKDENVIVYAVPVLSSKDISSPQTLKRVRDHSPSPSITSKRPRVALGSTQSPPTETTPSVQELCKKNGFNPRYLQGSLAHDWRTFMVQTTFSRLQPLDLETGKNNPKRDDSFLRQKSGRVTAEEDVKLPEQGFGSSPVYTPMLHHARRPHGFQHQLPPFSLPLPHANTSELKPTLAYVVVGPRVRGKFDAAKAKDLCVPNGKIRGQLTLGKEIRFMVEENGKQVEKLVKPEQVIGESEIPSVSSSLMDVARLFLLSSLDYRSL